MINIRYKLANNAHYTINESQRRFIDFRVGRVVWAQTQDTLLGDMDDQVTDCIHWTVDGTIFD